ncbi:NINE protein [Amnibacterium sp. CER49]|uniref:NINE protein n=1 Tax=Amnibacterium sp. CER49 TaxID=3039161 RepID=UPI00244746CE|nr:NINE protein [Amnibacterium sp. CER49]MDH2445116.1 NINE protein [Amnibacterium sp. CER49]
MNDRFRDFRRRSGSDRITVAHQEPSRPPSPRTQGEWQARRRLVVACVLLLLLGGLGAHRFFLRRIKSGTIMFLMGAGSLALNFSDHTVGHGLYGFAGVILGTALSVWWLADAFGMRSLATGPSEPRVPLIDYKL